MTGWRRLACALLCAAITLAPALAEARAGGSYSSGGGSSFSSQGSRGSQTWSGNGAQPLQRSITPQPSPYAPYQGGPRPYAPQPGFALSHPFLTGLAGGFFGSWIGSMLFPHWGGYGGGYGVSPFGGFVGGLFSWLLIIGVIYLVIQLFRRRRYGASTMPDLGPMGYTPDYAEPMTRGGMGSTMGAPRGLTVTQADFDEFEALLKNIQGSWSRGDLTTLRRYVTPEMLSYFAEELAGNSSQGVENHVEQVTLVNGDLRESWDDGNLQYATAALRWSALDYTVRTDRKPGDPNYVASGDPNRPTEAEEVWTFVRSPGGHWLLSAIQQV